MDRPKKLINLDCLQFFHKQYYLLPTSTMNTRPPSLTNDLLSLVVAKMPFDEQYTTSVSMYLKESWRKKFLQDKVFADGVNASLRKAFFGNTVDVYTLMKTRILNIPLDFVHGPDVCLHKIPVWQRLSREKCVSVYNVVLKKCLLVDDVQTEIELRIKNVRKSDTKFHLCLKVNMMDRIDYEYIGRAFRTMVIDSEDCTSIPDLFALPTGQHKNLESCGPDMAQYTWDDYNYVLIPNYIDSVIPQEFQTMGWSGEQLREILF